ncbi:MAG: UDP-N-acetylmuramate dehydrogenase [Muribaculaceae bacterium]|nr:UDP-N-acetylmuramate dehydrogenase [Muribaculaceae bacterium]
MITSRQNFDLTDRNTFAMPVKCGCFMEYDSRDDISFLLSTIRQEVDIFHIGAGSNLLFLRDYPGVVIHSAIRGIETVKTDGDTVLVRAGAGETMDSFIEEMGGRGLWGVENLSGIPGEVGSAAVQNVGAYGVEAADVIDTIEAFDRSRGEFVNLKAEDCGYGYRWSMFKNPVMKKNYIIASVTFRLSATPKPNTTYPALSKRFATPPATPGEVREAVIEIRNTKLPDPARVPSAGSFFKNPVVDRETFERICEKEGGPENVPHYDVESGVKIPAAWMIDRCGWKGKSMGNVAVWHSQPLVIVNPERKGTPGEVVALENAIIASVRERFGITLSPEVEHI